MEGETVLSLRERLHDDLVMVSVLGPVVSDVIAALPEAAAAHLQDPAGAPLRRHRRPAGGWGRVSPPADTDALPVQHHEPGLGPAELALRTLERPPGAWPMAIAVSGDLVAFSFPHDLFDGVSAWAHITPIVERALGLPVTEPKPTLPRPLVATLRQAKLWDYEALQAARSVRRAAERETARPAQLAAPFEVDRSRRAAGWTGLVLDAQQLALLDATVSREHLRSEHASRRSLRSMKLAETVLAGLRHATPPEHDYRIRLPIDLRRYAPRGFWVEGPFSASYPIGTLRSGDNSAPALTTRVAGVASSKGPLAALVGDLSGLIKTRVRHPLSRPRLDSGRDTFDLTISMLPSRVAEGFWASSAERVNGVLQFNPVQPTAPYVQVADAQHLVTISLWDECGIVDPARFEQGILNALADRVDLSEKSDTP